MFAELETIIRTINLPQELRQLWLSAPGYLRKEELALLLGIFKTASNSEIRDLSELLKEKVSAMTSGDVQLWRKIIQKEKRALS